VKGRCAAARHIALVKYTNWVMPFQSVSIKGSVGIRALYSGSVAERRNNGPLAERITRCIIRHTH
jgi:hypothetical protein